MSSPSKRREMDLMKLMMSDYKVETVNDGIQEFFVDFHGPSESLYQGGVWRVRVELPDAYPYKSPSIGFVNKIYHPNVDEMSGSVCLDVINQTWSPMFDLVNVFEVFLPQLLLYPNPSDPLNGEAAALMMRDRPAYEQKVKALNENHLKEFDYILYASSSFTRLPTPIPSYMYTLPRVSVPHRNLVIKVEKDLEMEKHGRKPEPNIFASVWRFLRRCLFLVLALGPMPNHIAFIMDGNRRYAKRRNVKEGTGHGVGFTTLTSICQYCYEMGVKYVTVYAFSIDNFKRKPEEVQSLMDLMKEKIDELLEEGSIVQKYGFRINFWGSLDLLSEPVRLAAEKAMTHTADNTGPVLSVCVAYTSTNEIVRAIKKSCARKSFRTQGYVNCDGESVCEDINGYVTVADLEENLDTADCPDPDIVIRTSGEARLSNFLLWQTSLSHLQNPNPLWPEFSLRNLVWAILEYQKIYPYLEARRRLAKKEN
ncbi:unnamed protein product [Musa acuminata subsp. burmannicoides]